MPQDLLALYGPSIAALVAVAGWFRSHRLAEERAAREYRLRRLEDAYSQCQELYDGHLARVNWLAPLPSVSQENFFTAPPHPGKNMSQLIMIGAIFSEDLSAELDKVKKAHAKLKSEFQKLRGGVFSGKTLKSKSDYDVQLIDDNLQELSVATTALKRVIEKAAAETALSHQRR